MVACLLVTAHAEALMPVYYDRVAFEVATGCLVRQGFERYVVPDSSPEQRLDLCPAGQRACQADLGEQVLAIATTPRTDTGAQLSIFSSNAYHAHPSQGIVAPGGYMQPGDYEIVLPDSDCFGADMSGESGEAILRIITTDGLETDVWCGTEEEFCGVKSSVPIARVLFLAGVPERGGDALLDNVAWEPPSVALIAPKVRVTQDILIQTVGFVTMKTLQKQFPKGWYLDSKVYQRERAQRVTVLAKQPRTLLFRVPIFRWQQP